MLYQSRHIEWGEVRSEANARLAGEPVRVIAGKTVTQATQLLPWVLRSAVPLSKGKFTLYDSGGGLSNYQKQTEIDTEYEESGWKQPRCS